VKIQLHGLDKLRDAGRDLDKLLGESFGPEAIADAINHTAFQARKALHAEMASVFTDPTPWTLKSIQVFQAKPKQLDAAIWINDYRASKDPAPDKWLKAQVFGGGRAEKKLERALRAKNILPAGKFVVPAKGARLDAYGNISKGHVMQILSGLMASEIFSGVTSNATDSKRSLAKGHKKAFFVMRRGKTPIGIAERRGIVHQVADRELLTNLDLAIVKAIG